MDAAAELFGEFVADGAIVEGKGAEAGPIVAYIPDSNATAVAITRDRRADDIRLAVENAHAACGVVRDRAVGERQVGGGTGVIPKVGPEPRKRPGDADTNSDIHVAGDNHLGQGERRVVVDDRSATVPATGAP